MGGESNLETLIRDMKPQVVPGEYVFCSVQESQLESHFKPLLVFREQEGPTVITTKAIADEHAFSYDSTWGMISLSVHSDLAAVGFLAAITNRLAEAGISVNAVSAFYHDHLFVPHARVDEAYSILLKMSE